MLLKRIAFENKFTVAEQETLLYNSIEKVLKNHPEVAKDTRVLGIGSWMTGKAGATSDIDATPAHLDKRVEEQLVTEINQVIREETRGQGSHNGWTMTCLGKNETGNISGFFPGFLSEKYFSGKQLPHKLRIVYDFHPAHP